MVETLPNGKPRCHMARNEIPPFLGPAIILCEVLTRATVTTARGEAQSSVPRAVIHKQILDVAESRPNATMDEIAGDVSGASVDLVERVLDDYGDPASDPSPAMPEYSTGLSRDPQGPEVDLTDKQREVLRLIYEDPTASQRELADMLNVSHTAVYDRLRTIDEFDWADRWPFVSRLFDTTAPTDDDRRVDIETFPDQLEAIGGQRENGSATVQPSTGSPRLERKVVRACLEADFVSDDELLQIVEVWLQRVRDHVN